MAETGDSGRFASFSKAPPLNSSGGSARFTWPAPKTTRPMDPSWTGFLESQPTMGFERGRSKLSGSSPSRVLAGAILSFWFLKRREVSGLDVVRVRRAPPAPSRERKARAAERSGAAGLALRGVGSGLRTFGALSPEHAAFPKNLSSWPGLFRRRPCESFPEGSALKGGKGAVLRFPLESRRHPP